MRQHTFIPIPGSAQSHDAHHVPLAAFPPVFAVLALGDVDFVVLTAIAALAAIVLAHWIRPRKK